MTTARIKLPPKLVPVFTPPMGAVRFRGAYGGRGSGKTRSFALMSAIRAYELDQAHESGVILCSREFQNSLDESSMEEVKVAIQSKPWLAAHFDIGERYIRTKSGRIKYVFAGLRHNLDSIKSKARLLLNWTDEAEPVSENAYRKLLPTIREDNSECWITWNPEHRDSPTDRRFRQRQRDDALIVELQYWDNPWFPKVLEKDRLADQEDLDPSAYAWVWEGEYLEQSEAQVLHGKVAVREFEAQDTWDGPYYGMDFGFAEDPTTANRCWIHDRTLYVDHEAYKVGLELDETAAFVIDKVPGIERHVVRADSARPESISYLKRKGLPKIRGVEKGAGSVEDGIKHLRSYREIVIHPRCRETIRETRLYSYKVDRLTGDILPKVIVDKHNHTIDDIRYALEPLIKHRASPRVRAL